MKNYKNYLIALLVVLLGASLTIQPSQGAGTSKEAKIVQYDHCLSVYEQNFTSGYSGLDTEFSNCAKYKP